MKQYFNTIVVFMLLAFCVACTQSVPKPNKLMSKANVEEVLYQMYVIEGKGRLFYMDSSQNMVQNYINEELNALFATYGVNYAIFNANVNYYFSDEEQAKKIQTSITNRLVHKQAQLSKQIREKHPARDTLIEGESQKIYNNIDNIKK